VKLETLVWEIRCVLVAWFVDRLNFRNAFNVSSILNRRFGARIIRSLSNSSVSCIQPSLLPSSLLLTPSHLWSIPLTIPTPNLKNHQLSEPLPFHKTTFLPPKTIFSQGLSSRKPKQRARRLLQSTKLYWFPDYYAFLFRGSVSGAFQKHSQTLMSAIFFALWSLTESSVDL
jgi:hypothetical protein